MTTSQFAKADLEQMLHQACQDVGYKSVVELPSEVAQRFAELVEQKSLTDLNAQAERFERGWHLRGTLRVTEVGRRRQVRRPALTASSASPQL